MMCQVCSAEGDGSVPCGVCGEASWMPGPPKKRGRPKKEPPAPAAEQVSPGSGDESSQ